MKKDNLGDRMKKYEYVKTNDILIPRVPVYARLDGVCFSSYTKNMDKPFDIVLNNFMSIATRGLMEYFRCDLGYHQSDEISLVWKNDNINSEFIYGGKTHKLLSILASKCTSEFLKFGSYHDIEISELPLFDCRIMNLPNLTECANMILWRELDAIRNSISSLARKYYSDKVLYKKSCTDMKDMLKDKNIDWNSYPDSFKRGDYFKRITDKNGRSLVVEYTNIPYMINISNMVDVLFSNERCEPIMKEKLSIVKNEGATNKEPIGEGDFFDINLSLKDFELSPEEKTKINDIGRWLERSKNNISSEMYGV